MEQQNNNLNRRMLAALALASFMSIGMAQDARDAELERLTPAAMQGKLPRVVFVAGCGDLNLTYVGSSGSPDVASTYNPWPTGFNLSISGQSQGGLDEMGNNKRRNFNIFGYPAFNANAVVEATLRTDVYMPMNGAMPSNGNDTLLCYDDSTSPGTDVPIGSQLYGTNLTKWLRAKGVKSGEWVSVVVNLTPNGTGGGIFVYGINGYGNPIAGKYYGQYTTVPVTTRLQVLQAASDGDLQGVVADDTPCSYVELHVKAF